MPLAILFGLLLSGTVLFAQDAFVQGNIRDENGEPMIGVNILSKNKATGVITDLEGNYTISVAPADTLEFSYVGYVTQTIPLENKTTISLTMLPAQELLDEVVVIGYGTVRKKDITSSITTVTGAAINQTQQGNFTEALQGLAAGVQVFSTDGSPRANPTVIIRGATSINGNPNPMYVVDGIPIGRNPNQINSEDIESISILKDASATAIYGTQAANGVILITTKKGKMGQSNFSVNASYGLQHLLKPEVATAKEFMLVHNEKYFNAGQGEFALFSQEQIDTLQGTDWWNEAMRTFAPKYNLNIGFDGGTKKFRYSGSLGYFRQESQMEVGNWDKITARFNTEYHFNDNIKFGQNFYPRMESWINTPQIWGLISMDPTTPVYRPEEEQVGLNRYSIFQRSYNNDNWNPMGEIERAKVNNNNLLVGLQTNTYLNIRFLKDFVFNTQLGLDFSSVMMDRYNPEFSIDPGKESNQINSVSREVDNFYGYVWNNTLSYMKTLGGLHNINLMVGSVAQKDRTRDVWGYKKAIPNDNPSLRYLTAAEQEPDANGNDVVNTALFSLLGRVMYNYSEKYYVNASIRRDGSYKFPENNRYAIFPAVSVAWSAHNEDFIKDLSTISQLKIRAGWGRVGNQEALASNVFLYTLEKSPYVYGSSGATLVGAYNNQYANQNIQWETVEDYSGGVDLVLFKNRLSVTADLFSKRTIDMIMLKSYPFFSGYPDFEAQIWTNIGSIKSNGLELSLGYSDSKGDFSWSGTLNLTHVKTSTLKLADGADYNDAWWGDYVTKTREGELVGQFWGYKTDGLFQNQTEVLAHTDEHGNIMQPDAKPGDVRFVDLNADGVINDEDNTFIGSGQPDLTTGLNLYAAYKGFSITMSLYASFGADVFNATLWEWSWGANTSNVYAGSYDDAWHGEGTSNRLPILDLNDYNQNYDKISDIYIENGNFFKFRYIKLAYELPPLKGLKSASVFANVENPLFYTKYTGFDPEQYGSVTAQNIDWGDKYPNPIVITFGFSVQF
jgi:TonB-linked SusC/RagA family outer membrane protein